uniref:DNA topoisomerase (ATP-hydrolyzing) n=1 Tax=Scleropages formosus TaxID=113540 RepID=A0A8C9SCS8_SCLFO
MFEELLEVERLRTKLLKDQDGEEWENSVIPSIQDVLSRIEKVILEIIESLSKREPPVLLLQNRSTWVNIRFHNTVGLHMDSQSMVSTVRSDCSSSVTRFASTLKILSVVYKLVQRNTYATKRDIYYNDTQLFGSQRTVDSIVDDISCMLKVPRRSLHVLATSKGLISGDLCYQEEDGTRVNCSSNYINIIRLLDDEFGTSLSPCIMVTGKGVPDLNSRLMVRKLWDTLHIPVFVLVDADPHGTALPSLHLMILKTGSMSFEAQNLTVPSVKWLGLLPTDIERLRVPKDALIPFTKKDESKLSSLLKRPYAATQPAWRREMELMQKWKQKAEIQCLTSFAPDFLTRVYLPNKLRYGGWI